MVWMYDRSNICSVKAVQPKGKEGTKATFIAKDTKYKVSNPNPNNYLMIYTIIQSTLEDSEFLELSIYVGDI